MVQSSRYNNLQTSEWDDLIPADLFRASRSPTVRRQVLLKLLLLWAWEDALQVLRHPTCMTIAFFQAPSRDGWKLKTSKTRVKGHSFFIPPNNGRHWFSIQDAYTITNKLKGFPCLIKAQNPSRLPQSLPSFIQRIIKSSWDALLSFRLQIQKSTLNLASSTKVQPSQCLAKSYEITLHLNAWIIALDIDHSTLSIWCRCCYWFAASSDHLHQIAKSRWQGDEGFFLSINRSLRPYQSCGVWSYFELHWSSMTNRMKSLMEG